MSEIDNLKNKCLLFNQFMLDYGGFPVALASAFAESNKLINEAYSKGNIKCLRSMNSDIDNQVIRHMSQSMVSKLKALFKQKLDIDFKAAEISQLKAMRKMIKKGKVANEEEYRLILEYENDNVSDLLNLNEIEKLNSLLVKFELRT